MNLPITNKIKPKTCNTWKSCHFNANVTAQITIVRPLSSTIRVVADNSFVTDIPAKLKNAIEKIFPKQNKEFKQIKHRKIYFYQ